MPNRLFKNEARGCNVSGRRLALRSWRPLRSILCSCALGVLCVALTSCVRLASQSTNIAKGCPYTMTPRPNYPLTTDPGDDRQLTDGVYTSANPIWVHQSTVGWNNVSPVTIVIDLRSVQSIAGIAYSTAAGSAGVEWPRSILVLVSDDGRSYFPVADLADSGAGNAPPGGGYARFRFTAHNLVTHGRYVALIVDHNGPYAFCDEIEVEAGRPEVLHSPLTGPSTTDLEDYFARERTRRSIVRRLSSDLRDARAMLATASIGIEQNRQLARELDRLDASVASTAAPDPRTFRATLPLNDLDAAIYAVRGAIAHAAGQPELSAWPVNPWDFVSPFDKPTVAQTREPVSIAAMNGETRAGALNLSNATSAPVAVTLTIAGLPPDMRGDLQLSEVVWTDTGDLVPVADALLPLSSAQPAIAIPAGMTRQVWIAFSPAGRASRRYHASIEAAAGARAIRTGLELKILDGAFPRRPSLHVGGWDYTNRADMLGVTPDNRALLVDQLHALKVDSPWATSAVLPPGHYDEAGRLLQPPPTAPFDEWIAEWPDASAYHVFVSVSDRFAGAATSETPRFNTAVAQWITFWVKHAASRGVPASRLVLLLVDEPHTPAQHNLIVAWARAIKAAEPAVRLWENPTDPDPDRSRPASLDVVDVIALKTWLMRRQGAPFVDFYRRRSRSGQLAVYGASGPARLLDPYSYYRLQAWICAELGATSSFFWSFADDGGGHSWNEYGTPNTVYSPLFLARNGVTPSKHTEAIREGMEDFEYLTMLAQRVAVLARGDPPRPGLAAARELLSSAPATVLRSPGAEEERWLAAKDRSVADRVRLSIADAIERLR